MEEGSALIVIDKINSYDHPDAERLVGSVRGALPGIGRLMSGPGTGGSTSSTSTTTSAVGGRITRNWSTRR
jgi:hypothetical protein